MTLKHIENGDVDFQIITYLMQVHSLSLIVGLDVDWISGKCSDFLAWPASLGVRIEYL